MQRTSSDLKTNPHLHVIFLDGVYRELVDEVVFRELARLSTREVGEVLERAVNRMTRHVRAVAQERITQGPDGLVRIVLKKPFSDGTVAVDMDPLSLLCRLAASVPPPRLHTVRYAGVLAPASKLRPRIVPKPPATPANDVEPGALPLPPMPGGSRYRPWAELLKRCFAIDVLQCASCGGRMKLVALLTDLPQVRRFLRGIGEPTEHRRGSRREGPRSGRVACCGARLTTTSPSRRGSVPGVGTHDPRRQ